MERSPNMNINNYGYSNNSINNSDKFAIRNKKADSDNTIKTISEDSLTDKQKDALSKLREKYGNMDFYVVDSVNDENAKNILDKGTNEYTVLMTQDELEKMASNEEHLNMRMGELDEVMNMAEKLKAQYENESEDGEESKISKFTVTFNDDGTTSYFVELEKMSAKQKERIEASKEKKAEENKKAAKEAEKEKLEELRNPKASDHSANKVKKTQIKASSFDELMKKIGDYYQNEKMASIKTEEEKKIGQHIDFSL